MNADIQMVPMQEKHIPALAQLERLCFSQPWTESGLRSELHNKLAVFCVAEQNGQVLGYAGMQCVMGECYINNIAVFPQFRGIDRKSTRLNSSHPSSSRMPSSA